MNTQNARGQRIPNDGRPDEQSGLVLSGCSFTSGLPRRRLSQLHCDMQSLAIIVQSLRLPSMKMARFAASSRCRFFTRVDICWRRDYLLKRHLETPVVSKAHLYTQTVFQPPAKPTRCRPFQASVPADLAVFALPHQHNRWHPPPILQRRRPTGRVMKMTSSPRLCNPHLDIPFDASLSA